ncbi:CotO family spore coat protein [Oceanobacillus sp. CFH 90083]|uniref:CotO family spore coat protein n=1 Tax=Oceanobacillus sp. CFH 90083 TaxID=2592336 RepID=UPI00128B1599|nr:CotO family spore coat protein [Oceanobacillus sp. CFH 90083]
MTNKNKAQGPLLYISQPQLQESRAPMQENYVGDYRKTKQKDLQQASDKNRGRPKDRKDLFDDHSRAPGARSSKKKFMEMTVIEKVDYLTNRSEFAPPLKCEVITASEKKYRGLIRERKADTLSFQLNNRKNRIEIALKDIENIQLLGF